MHKEKKDLFQRITDAVNSTGIPSLPKTLSITELKPSDIVLGEVPMHLRHICSLIDEIINEQINCKNESDLYYLSKSASLLTSVFYFSVKIHLPVLYNYFGFRICSDWEIVAVSEDEARTLVADAIGLDLSEFVNELDDDETVTDSKLH